MLVYAWAERLSVRACLSACVLFWMLCVVYCFERACECVLYIECLSEWLNVCVGWACCRKSWIRRTNQMSKNKCVECVAWHLECFPLCVNVLFVLIHPNFPYFKCMCNLFLIYFYFIYLFCVCFFPKDFCVVFALFCFVVTVFYWMSVNFIFCLFFAR